TLFRARAATCDPAAARARDIAAPIPRLPPVTNATRAMPASPIARQDKWAKFASRGLISLKRRQLACMRQIKLCYAGLCFDGFVSSTLQENDPCSGTSWSTLDRKSVV